MCRPHRSPSCMATRQCSRASTMSSAPSLLLAEECARRSGIQFISGSLFQRRLRTEIWALPIGRGEVVGHTDTHMASLLSHHRSGLVARYVTDSHMARPSSHHRSGLVARYVADSHLASLLSHHRSGRVARYVADSHMASLLSHRWADLRGGLVPPMVCMLSFDSSSMSMVTANAFLKSGEVTEQVVQASLLSELWATRRSSRA